MRPRHATGIAAVALCASGCGLLGATPSGHSVQVRDLDSFRPDTLPYREGSLILAGTRLPVELQERRKDGRFEIVVLAHGKAVEVETYRAENGQFLFESLSGESFAPPIPILRFPLRSNDSWDWTGEFRLGPTARPAKATVATQPETLNLASGSLQATRVDIALTVETSKATTAERGLKFWLAPKAGVVRREFGASSLREPRAPEDRQP